MIPWAKDPWNEIIPNLWQGGLYFDRDQRLFEIEDAIPTNEFGLVVSMHPKWDTGPDAGVPHWRCRIPDGLLNADDRRLVAEAVDRVLIALEAERKVLVRCQAGYNRSGLVVALVLLALGHGADEAIALIRERRSEWALCNEHFVDLIRQRAAVKAGGPS
jgi:hypothetical protein